MKTPSADQYLANLLNGVKAVVIAKINSKTTANPRVGDKGNEDIGRKPDSPPLIIEGNHIARCALIKTLEFFSSNSKGDHNLFQCLYPNPKRL